MLYLKKKSLLILGLITLLNFNSCKKRLVFETQKSEQSNSGQTYYALASNTEVNKLTAHEAQTITTSNKAMIEDIQKNISEQWNGSAFTLMVPGNIEVFEKFLEDFLNQQKDKFYSIYSWPTEGTDIITLVLDNPLLESSKAESREEANIGKKPSVFFNKYLSYILEEKNLKYLYFDINPLFNELKIPNIDYFIQIIEELNTEITKNNLNIKIGLKFQYYQSNKEHIDSIFTHSSIQNFIKGIKVLGDYESYLAEMKRINFLSKIESLNLEGNIIGSKETDLLTLAKFLDSSSEIRALNLNDNAIGSYGKNLEVLAKIISKFKKLEYLVLSNNLIGANPDDLKNLVNIENLPKLNYIDLSNNLLGTNKEDISNLSKLIGKFENVKYVILNINKLGEYESNTEELFTAFHNFKYLSNLGLSSNELKKSESQVYQLLSHLPEIPKLEYLDISSNKIHFEGNTLQPISHALNLHAHLKEFSIKGNEFSCEDLSLDKNKTCR